LGVGESDGLITGGCLGKHAFSSVELAHSPWNRFSVAPLLARLCGGIDSQQILDLGTFRIFLSIVKRIPLELG
jgi:hypothetical protein